ncbi:MAG: cytochrome c1 [Pseudomonadota bacterium]
MIKKIIFAALLCLPVVAMASSEGYKLDEFKPNVEDKLSLQRGARVFVNYCVNCHSASYMRYSRLQDLGLTEKQIVDNLMVTGEKPVETMTAALRPADAEAWFGVAPPDLTVIARAKEQGPNWLYTYLRTFYRDPSRPTGWNNLVFTNVGMPHALWELQGERVAHYRTEKGHDGKEAHVFDRFETTRPGKMSAAEYDATVKDLVNYLVYMGEPAQTKRKITGIFVIFFLVGLTVLAYYLKKEFWKDIH